MESHLAPLWRELMGAELRAERHRQRRTLAEVAAAAGVSMQHLSDVERGRKDPSSELLAAILGALGIELPLLLLRTADASLLHAGERHGSADQRTGAAVLELHSAPGDSPGIAAGAPGRGAVRLRRGRPQQGAPGISLLAAA
jgi:transcriptional regulator with XRE-family HTH domain